MVIEFDIQEREIKTFFFLTLEYNLVFLAL